MNARQIKVIYSLGGRLGIVGKDRSDELHTLIAGLTGKESVKELTFEEYQLVTAEMKKRIGTQMPEHAKKTIRRDSAAGMTAGQQSKVWHLMYELQKFDIVPIGATISERVCGIIKRELHVDAQPKTPFVWLSYDDGIILIERLKKYVYNAEKRYLKTF